MIKLLVIAAALFSAPAMARGPTVGEVLGSAVDAAIDDTVQNKYNRRYEDYRSRRRDYYYYVPRAPRRGYYSPEEYEEYNYGYTYCYSDTYSDRGQRYTVEVCR